VTIGTNTPEAGVTSARKRESRAESLLPLTPLSLAVLLALAEGERHGYALVKAI